MKQSKLQIYALIAEIISAVAIVVSLLLVAYQLDQSNTVSSLDVDMILYERGLERSRLIMENPDLASILARDSSSTKTFSAQDKLRYLEFYSVMFNTWEIGWYYREKGILSEESWQEWDQWFISETLKLPLFAWTSNRHNFTAITFRDHVEEVLGLNIAP